MDNRILTEVRTAYEISKSKFIATVAPVSSEEEAKDFIQKIKKEFRDANHNCSAYILNENNGIERYSDDGEPSGTAGMPMLEVLRGSRLSQVVAVVTRYFGGIKLGTGGLVRAYTKSLQQVLEEAEVVAFSIFSQISVTVPYTLSGKVQHYIEREALHTEDIIYDEAVTYHIIIEKENCDRLESDLTELTNGQASYETVRTGEGYKDRKGAAIITQ